MNPILELAAVFATDSPDDEQLYTELERLSAARLLTEANLKKAFAEVLGAQPPAGVSMIVATVNIIFMVLQNAGERGKAAHVLFVAANHLDERTGDVQERISALEMAAYFYDMSRHFFLQADIRYGRSFINEANVWQQLAGLQVEPIINCRKAVELYAQATAILPEESEDAGVCLLNEATTWQRLAALGDDPCTNYQKALSLYRRAKRTIEPDSLAMAACLANEAAVWQQLAAKDTEKASEHYQYAIALYNKAIGICPPSSPEVAGHLESMGSAWRSLASLGEKLIVNLKKAALVYTEASKGSGPDPLVSGTVLKYQAAELQDREQIGINPDPDCFNVIELLT